MKPVRGLLVPTRSKSSPASADPIEYCFREIGAQHNTYADPPKLLEPTSPCWHEEVHRSIKRPIELTLPEAAMPLTHHPNLGRGTREVTRGAHCRKVSPRDRPEPAPHFVLADLLALPPCIISPWGRSMKGDRSNRPAPQQYLKERQPTPPSSVGAKRIHPASIYRQQPPP
jgi:hypothetical protein